LSGTDCVYLWVDGIHLKVRLEQEKLCLLVMIGVRGDGRKELVALADGFRESAESWADLLRGCRRRGMIAPVLAVGDGALGFRKAVREVFPETREQRCWFRKQANVLAALPKSAHLGALAAIKDIYNAGDIDKAQLAIKAFEIDYGAKHPKAVAKIVDDDDAGVLLQFYKYPAEHWIHLRATNPIESTFATVRLRTKVTKGPRSRAAGIATAYKVDRRRASPLAGRQRPAPGRPGACRRGVPQRQTARTPHRHHPTRSRIKPNRKSPEPPRSTGIYILLRVVVWHLLSLLPRPLRRPVPQPTSSRESISPVCGRSLPAPPPASASKRHAPWRPLAPKSRSQFGTRQLGWASLT
jgi:hypothetical protein